MSMDRKYRIQRVIGEPDWDTIAKAAIDQCLWRPCGQASAYA